MTDSSATPDRGKTAGSTAGERLKEIEAMLAAIRNRIKDHAELDDGDSYHIGHDYYATDVPCLLTLIAEKDREIEMVKGALSNAESLIEGLRYIHDSNLSDALASLSELDYARHMLGEVRSSCRDYLQTRTPAVKPEGETPPSNADETED